MFKYLLHRTLSITVGMSLLSGCIANNEKSAIDQLCDSDQNQLCDKLPLDEKLCSKQRIELVTLQLLKAQKNGIEISLNELKNERDLLKTHKMCLYDEYRNLPIFQSTHRGKLKREQAIVKKEFVSIEEAIKKQKLKEMDVSGVYLSYLPHHFLIELYPI